jgi:hypothetical protein
LLAVLQILAVERLATGFEPRCDDEGIVEAESVPLLHVESAPIQRRSRVNAPQGNQYTVQELARVFSRGVELAGDDVDRLLDHLVADAAAPGLQGLPHHVFRALVLPYIRLIEQVDENVAVEEHVSAHSFPLS